jgi:hypothetical protein
LAFDGGAQSAFGNWQSAMTRPTRYRVVVLTSWDRGMSECNNRLLSF